VVRGVVMIVICKSTSRCDLFRSSVQKGAEYPNDEAAEDQARFVEAKKKTKALWGD
jgi:hypothetical protein